MQFSTNSTANIFFRIKQKTAIKKYFQKMQNFTGSARSYGGEETYIEQIVH